MKLMWLSVIVFVLFKFVRQELSPKFEKCRDEFFYQKTEPTMKERIGSVEICQQLGNHYYYATLYDTINRIPRYSAYTLYFDKCGNRYKEWFLEPELANRRDKNMVEISKANNNTFDYGRKQAVNVDYTRTGYDRGHLNPQLYHCETLYSRRATNTLTNIAPQNRLFNQGIWQNLEKILYDISHKYCNFIGARRYFITGVLPSSNTLINKRVNVPTHYWTAVCCDSSRGDEAHRSEGWSVGFKGKNVNDSVIYIYEIQSFLKKNSPKLFADYKDQDGKVVTNCQFNTTKAEVIFDEIAASNNRFRKKKKTESLLTRIRNYFKKKIMRTEL